MRNKYGGFTDEEHRANVQKFYARKRRQGMMSPTPQAQAGARHKLAREINRASTELLDLLAQGRKADVFRSEGFDLSLVVDSLQDSLEQLSEFLGDEFKAPEIEVRT